MSVVRPAVKSVFILACLTAVAAAYFVNTPLPLFSERLKEILLAAGILWSAGGWGMRLLQILQMPSLTPLEKFLFAETLGLGLLSSLMVVMGAANAWVPLGGLILIGIGILGSAPFLFNLSKLFSFETGPVVLPAEFFGPAAALATGGILSFILALAPITYYDSLVYHFAMPAAYLQAHHWLPLQGLIYSAFPQTLEMLWTLGLLVGNDTVANLIAWSMGVLLTTAVIAYARRFLDLSVGLIAAALLALMPACLLLSSGGYVDVGLTLFSFMALYAACLRGAELRPGTLVCAGLFAGWAVGTKYTGGINVVLVGTFLMARLRSEGPRQTVRGLLFFAGSVLLVFGPWLIKNMLYVGNPVFPFFYDKGIRALNPWVPEAAAGYFAGITEYYSRSLLQLPALLWQAVVNGIDFGRGIDVLGDFGWLPLIAFLPALWLCRKLPETIRLLLGFTALFFVMWAVSRPVLRFLLPISPLLALLGAYAWVHGIRPQAAAVRWIARGFLASFLLSGLFLFFYTTSMLSSFGAAVGLEDRGMYLRRTLNYYGAAEFVNTQTPLDSRVYVLGDQRGYYYNRAVWITPVFSRSPLVEWANTAPTAQALREKLRAEGMTHLVVNRAEFERLKVYPFSRFDAQGQKTWDRLQASLTPLYRDRACDVYAL